MTTGWRLTFLATGLCGLLFGAGLTTVNLVAGVIVVIASLAWIASIK